MGQRKSRSKTKETKPNKIIKNGYNFWKNNLEKIKGKKKLEIACAIYFELYNATQDIHQFFGGITLEKKALKLYDTINWLFMNLHKNEINCIRIFDSIGNNHNNINLKIVYYRELLRAFNVTMIYYFKTEYTRDIQKCIEQIFIKSAQSSINNNSIIKRNSGMNALCNLETCLLSNNAKEYLFAYLSQNDCIEMVIFLRLLIKYKHCNNNYLKYIILQEILNKCILVNSPFEINISFETRIQYIGCIQNIKLKYNSKRNIEINSDILSNIQREMYKLIKTQHWRPFVRLMNESKLK